MGSQSDWPVMRHAGLTLESLGITYESRIISAHRTPERHGEYCAAAKGRGLQVIIAGAGGAAHLAGVTAALTPLPILGVPMESAALKGMDSLLSTVQMPGGIPVGRWRSANPAPSTLPFSPPPSSPSATTGLPARSTTGAPHKPPRCRKYPSIRRISRSAAGGCL